MLLAIAIVVLLNFALNLFLVPHYGLIASSVSLLVAVVMYAAFVLVLAFRASRAIPAGGK